MKWLLSGFVVGALAALLHVPPGLAIFIWLVFNLCTPPRPLSAEEEQERMWREFQRRS